MNRSNNNNICIHKHTFTVVDSKQEDKKKLVKRTRYGGCTRRRVYSNWNVNVLMTSNEPTIFKRECDMFSLNNNSQMMKCIERTARTTANKNAIAATSTATGGAGTATREGLLWRPRRVTNLDHNERKQKATNLDVDALTTDLDVENN